MSVRFADLAVSHALVALVSVKNGSADVDVQAYRNSDHPHAQGHWIGTT